MLKLKKKRKITTHYELTESDMIYAVPVVLIFIEKV